jgi:hypothetical protein
VAVDAVAVEAELTIRKAITVELNKRSTVEKLTTRPNFDHFIFSIKFGFQITMTWKHQFFLCIIILNQLAFKLLCF